MNKFITLLLALLFVPPLSTLAKQYEIFDGRYYNGKYYPRVDIIDVTWLKPRRMEFHIFSKNDPVDIAYKIIKRKGTNKIVMLLNYYLRSGTEVLCRDVVLTTGFNENVPTYAYMDRSDPDFDNIWISLEPVKETKNLKAYNFKSYKPCEGDDRSNPEKTAAKPGKPSGVFAPGASTPNNSSNDAAPSGPSQKRKGKGVGVDYENHAMPFSF